MLRMKNITSEVEDLSAMVSNRVPEEERIKQKSGCKSRPSRSMLRRNNNSPEIGGGGGGGGGGGREWGGRRRAKIKDSNVVVQDSDN